MTRYRLIIKFLNIAWQLILLIIMVSSTLIFASDFSTIKKSGGSFLTYLNFALLLFAVFLITHALLKTIKKQD